MIDLDLQRRIDRARGPFTVTGGVIASLGGRGFPGPTLVKTPDSIKVDGRRSWVARSRFGQSVTGDDDA